MSKADNKDPRLCKGKNKVNNKKILDVVLVSLLLNLNKFLFLLQCFYCWFWSINFRLELFLVVLTFCVCWNQFRQTFDLMWEKTWGRITFLIKLKFSKLDKFDGPIFEGMYIWRGRMGQKEKRELIFGILIGLHFWMCIFEGEGLTHRGVYNGSLQYYLKSEHQK